MTPATHLSPTILREYDIRGTIGENIGEAEFRAIGRAFGSQLRAEGGESVAVGYDGRLSSPTLEAAVTQGLAQAGICVLRVGRGIA